MSLSKFTFLKNNTNLSGGSLEFSKDGMKLYVAKNNIISQYKLSKPFDIETTTLESSQNLNDGTNKFARINSMRFNEDGSKLYVATSYVSFFFNSTTQNYGNALLAATSAGRELATIVNATENAYIVSIINTTSYIGGTSSGGHGSDRTSTYWSWNDGSTWDYVNWNTGEPNDTGGNEDNLEIRTDGRWNDIGAGFTTRGSVQMATSYEVREYDLPRKYYINTFLYKQSISLNYPTISLSIHNNGRKMLISSNNLIYNYRLSKSYDITSNSLDLTTSFTNPHARGFIFSLDGIRMFILGSNNKIYNYQTKAFSTASMKSVNDIFDFIQSSNPRDITFNNNGTNMYIIDDISGIYVFKGSSSVSLFRIKPKTSSKQIDPVKEVIEFLESLTQKEINNNTLQFLISRYRNNREALMKIEKAFGVSIVY